MLTFDQLKNKHKRFTKGDEVILQRSLPPDLRGMGAAIHRGERGTVECLSVRTRERSIYWVVKFPSDKHYFHQVQDKDLKKPPKLVFNRFLFLDLE